MTVSKYQRLSDPPADFVPVTLTGDTTLSADCRGLLVLGTGDVAIASISRPTTKVVLPSVPVGILPGRFAVVYSTGNGTSASNVFALY